uniref:Uncharacterized protein n=1 Tax=Arundo donax TaxID=35708 RepID=A0A0A9BLV3_ARUDO
MRLQPFPFIFLLLPLLGIPHYQSSDQHPAVMLV